MHDVAPEFDTLSATLGQIEAVSGSVPWRGDRRYTRQDLSAAAERLDLASAQVNTHCPQGLFYEFSDRLILELAFVQKEVDVRLRHMHCCVGKNHAPGTDKPTGMVGMDVSDQDIRDLFRLVARRRQTRR